MNESHATTIKKINAAVREQTKGTPMTPTEEGWWLADRGVELARRVTNWRLNGSNVGEDYELMIELARSILERVDGGK